MQQIIEAHFARVVRIFIYFFSSIVATFLSAMVFAEGDEFESKKSPPFIEEISIYGDYNSMGTSGAKVTAAYSYTDFDNDPESASRYEWFVMPADKPTLDCIDNEVCIRITDFSYGTADDYPVLALGPDVIGTQINWSLAQFDNWQDLNGMLLAFCVTPQNISEIGDARCTISNQPLSDIDTTDKPIAYQLTITPSTGITINSKLIGSYKFSDGQDAEQNSRFRWQNEKGHVVANGISPGSDQGVELRLADLETLEEVIGHRLRFCIIPRDEQGDEGEMACSLLTDEIIGNDNEPPQLQNLRINGDVVIGSDIHGVYQYLDPEMDPEDGDAELRSVQWQYRATPSAPWQSAMGSGLSMMVSNSAGELRFCMTPYATEGTIAGTEVCSQSRTIMTALPGELLILRDRYASQVSHCGSDAAPAFLCSGLLTKSALPGKSAWETMERNAVSFNYLRRDSNFSQFGNGENHGLIFLPVIGTGDDHRPDNFEIYCAFPVTADTGRRNANGCGQHQDFGIVSDYCYSQGITNLSDWHNHFYSVSENLRQSHQCGFDVYDYIDHGSAEHFMMSLQARNNIIGSYLSIPNELRIESWLNLSLSEVPIEVFFYTDLSGLVDAQRDQRAYFESTGLLLPLVSISLPKDRFSYAQINYYEDEQAALH